MTKELSKMLELAFSPYNDKRREIVASLPREMSYNQDGEVKTIKRELLLAEGIETTGLIQTEVARTITEGADAAKCWMNVLPIYNIKGNAYVHAYGETGIYAPVVAEAAEFPNRSQDYNSVTFVPLKYGLSPKVSNEMVEDGLVDAIALEIKFAGMAVMNAVEQKINNTMLEGSGAEVDTGGASQGAKAIIAANAKLRAVGFGPTDVVMHPDMEAFVGLDLVPSYNFGGQQMANNGMVPQGYIGVDWHTCGVADVAGGTYTWEYNSDGDIGGMVLDASRAGGIAISRPLTVKEFEDPIHDLQSMTVSMRADAKVFLSTAIVRIEY